MKDKKIMWLSGLSIVNVIFSCFSFFSISSSKEQALRLVDSFPESMHDRLVLIYNNDLFYILPGIFCMFFGFLILYFCIKNKVSNKKGIVFGFFIASFLLSNDSIISICSIIGIIICASVKCENVREKKDIPIVKVEKLTKKTVLSSLLCLFVYFSIMFIPFDLNVFFVVMFYFVIFGLCLYLFRNEIFNGFKLIFNNFRTYVSFIVPKLGIIYIIYVISAIIVVYIFKQGISENQQSIEELSLFISFPLAVFWAPIVEETLFRGCLRKLFKNDILFIVLSGFIFGLLHTMGEESFLSAFTLMIPYGVLGSGFAYIYVKTNNIAANMLCHSMHNFVGMIIQIILFHI